MKSLFVIAALIGLTACAAPAPAGPVIAPKVSAEQERDFFRMILREGAALPSEEEPSISVGYKICNYRLQGNSEADIHEVLTETGNLPSAVADVFADASRKHLCP